MAQALSEQARRRKALVDNAQDLMCSVDEQARFQSLSPASLKLWGYSPEELVGRLVTDITEQKETPFCAALEETRNILLAFENRIVHRDGRTLDMIWSARWSAEDGVYYCVVHDISERKYAEKLLKDSQEKLQFIVASLPIALLVVDENACIEAANEAAEKLFAEKAGSLPGQGLEKLLAALIPPGQDCLTFLLSNYLNKAGERTFKVTTGQERSVEIHLAEVSIAEMKRFILVMRDLSQRHEAEFLKGLFISLLSKDLSQPLLFIKSGLASVSRRGNKQLDSKGCLFLDQAESEMQRLSKLVFDLLEAESPANAMVLDLKRHSLADIVKRACASVAVLAQAQKIRLENRSGNSWLTCDADKIVQVLVNLLNNALKFSAADSLLTISTQETDSQITVSVIDQGRGIPAEKLESIFERFIQVDEYDHKTKGGSGLGLFICKLIIERHGGEIGVNSQEGNGACFWFRLPTSTR